MTAHDGHESSAGRAGKRWWLVVVPVTPGDPGPGVCKCARAGEMLPALNTGRYLSVVEATTELHALQLARANTPFGPGRAQWTLAMGVEVARVKVALEVAGVLAPATG